jgi:hypothetical protein
MTLRERTHVPSPSETPYTETSEQGFADWTRDHFRVREVLGGLSFEGPCPRCRHPITNVWFDEIYRARDHAPRQGSTEVPMICTCEITHPGAPNSRYGCGAHWVVEVE